MRFDEVFTMVKYTPIAWSTPARLRDLAFGTMLLFSVSRSGRVADKGVVPVDGGELLGGASKVHGDSGQNLVSLAKAGQGVKVDGVPAGATLAIRYESVEVGTISVVVIMSAISSACSGPNSRVAHSRVYSFIVSFVHRFVFHPRLSQ